MARPKKPKPAPKPPRQAHGAGSVTHDAARRAFRARLPRDLSGKRASRYFDTRPEAEAWLARSASDAAGVFDPGAPVGEYLNYWYRLQLPRLKPTTRLRLKYQLAACRPIAGYALDRLRADHILSLLAALDARGLTRRYSRDIGRLVYRALADAVKWKILADNVAADVALPKADRTQPKALDATDTARLLAKLPGHRFEAAYLLALFAGLRAGELLALRWASLDFEAGAVTVEHNEYVAAKREIGPPKSGGSEPVEVPAIVMARLRAIRDGQTVITPWVLGKPDGSRWAYVTLLRDWWAVCAEAGVARCGLHSGRHTYATGLMRAGTDLADIASLMRHASPAVTAQTYLRGSKTRRRQAVEALGEGFPEPDEAIGAAIGAADAG